MKTRIQNLSLLPALITGLGLMLSGRANAQTFTNLHSFTATFSPNYTNNDGATPNYAGLVLSRGLLYGTTALGGTNGNGTVFAIHNNTSGPVNLLHTFTATSGSNMTNSDGANPNAGLILSGGILYGTAYAGGTNGSGTVFAVNTNGTGFAPLHSFTPLVSGTNSDGANPICSLMIASNTLYGTTTSGGTNGSGTVFAVNTDGMGFTILHTFAATSTNLLGFYTNSDGTGPSTLIISGNVLYGTAYAGSTNGSGAVFAVKTDGTGFATLHRFTPLVSGTNSDGANPIGSLMITNNTLYGTASGGGTNGNGTVFALNTNGTSFAAVYSFTATSGSGSTNSDGAAPQAGLILSGDTLYGTAYYGGTNGFGTVFAVTTNGTGFTTLHTFAAATGSGSSNSDGANPNAGLILSGNTLYGTASTGGLNGNGTVFSLSYPSPQLSIVPSGANANLTWPIGVAGFSYSGYTLQSTPNLGSSAVWATNFSPPVVSNGQNTVTKPIAGTQMFFRLSQ